ncbi:MAG: DUF4198 domain-containing protein [Candidatus Omnitrophica bacterium]|nr:DUF4198 domain-containing protein [Candidatus Omnitrophota bacterium]
MKKIIFIFLTFSSLSFCHKVNIFTYKEGDKIFVEGYFSDGKPCKNSLIEIYNEKKEKIVEGKTDENGIFSFNIPDAQKIKIVLIADMGHKTEEEIELEKKIEKRQDLIVEKIISGDEIKKIVEESVEKAINPILKEFERERKKAKITDIIGGIGYIFGILGIFLYFRGRSSEWKK